MPLMMRIISNGYGRGMATDTERADFSSLNITRLPDSRHITL